MTRCGPGCPRAGCGRHRPEVDRPGPPGGVVSGTVERSGASSWSGGAMSVVVGYVSTPEGDAALDVAEDIIGAASREEAVLIVIGLRRRSPVGKLLLGSNAQRILLDAPCPVLAVKPEPA